MSGVKRVEAQVRLVDLSECEAERTATVTAEFTFDDRGPYARLLLQTSDESFSAEAKDLFAALQELRRQLHPWSPAVQGVRHGVWASPMARDNGAFRVNDLNEPRHAVVDLLADAADEELATVDEQIADFDAYWRAATKGARPNPLRRNPPG